MLAAAAAAIAALEDVGVAGWGAGAAGRAAAEGPEVGEVAAPGAALPSLTGLAGGGAALTMLTKAIAAVFSCTVPSALIIGPTSEVNGSMEPLRPSDDSHRLRLSSTERPCSLSWSRSRSADLKS